MPNLLRWAKEQNGLWPAPMAVAGNLVPALHQLESMLMVMSRWEIIWGKGWWWWFFQQKIVTVRAREHDFPLNKSLICFCWVMFLRIVPWHSSPFNHHHHLGKIKLQDVQPNLEWFFLVGWNLSPLSKGVCGSLITWGCSMFTLFCWQCSNWWICWNIMSYYIKDGFQVGKSNHTEALKR